MVCELDLNKFFRKISYVCLWLAISPPRGNHVNIFAYTKKTLLYSSIQNMRFNVSIYSIIYETYLI